MARRGWSRGQGRALLLACALVAGATGCSSEGLDRAQSLHTTLGTLDGVSDSDVATATATSSGLVGVVLDGRLEAPEVLAVLEDVAAAADRAGFAGYRLEVRRSPTEDDLLVVDDTFAGSRDAGGVVGTWVRAVDAFLGEVSYSVQPGNETIEVEAGGAVGHDVAEAARIGYGRSGTTWRFLAGPATFVVANRVGRRDVTLFNRVQRSVVSSVLPLPASAWRLERRSRHVLLDLEVDVPGGAEPRRITVERWAAAVRPLAEAAVRTTRYPDHPRWIQLSDVAADGRDTFGSWSSVADPVRGRDRHARGWDAWWDRLATRLR